MFRPSTGFFFGILLVVGGLALATALIDRSNVGRMSIVGDLDDRQLESIKASLVDVDIASREVEQVKRTLSELDWVHHANVRKNWPNAIEIEVFPESVIAYWNDNGFINSEGSVVSTGVLVGGDLPHLYGTQGSEQNVMEQFQQLSQMLNSYGLGIKVLTVTDRGAWSLETKNGVEVLLGKEDLKARMRRFLSVSVRLAERGEAMFVERMDARYMNGVAVHFEKDNQFKFTEFNKSLGERSL